ncbi:MAG: SDR family oxidoreductase [Synergistaceae bacterium]|nr:SDR family oxidoreductase [Synergistaceae bacterium]
MGLLSGKSAIITGSSRGIGRAIAFAFAREGADVVIHGTNAESLSALQAELRRSGARCEYAAGDIGEPSTADILAETCLRAFGKIDILVNNAGINSRYRFVDLPPEVWDRTLRTNLGGAFYTCKRVVPVMLERGSGAIVNVSSSAGKTAHPNASACYGASKAALDALTRQLAYELAPHGIRVNSVCPGPIETDMSRQWTPEYREKVLESVPLRRLGREEDVADAVVFLASDKASFIVGESVNVNGGKYMN